MTTARDLLKDYISGDTLYPEEFRYQSIVREIQGVPYRDISTDEKSPSGWTIVFPAWNDPHLLSIALHGIVKHSAFQHKIVLVWSDPTAFQNDPVVSGTLGGDDCSAGCAYDPETKDPYVKYHTSREFFEKNAQWLHAHNIHIHDITEDCLRFRREYLEGKISAGKTGQFIGWIDVAFKLNYGLSQVNTDWALMLFEDDMYPSPGWDLRLMETVQVEPGRHSIYLPTQVYPMRTRSWGLPPSPLYKDIWEDFRHLNCNNIPWFYDQPDEDSRPCIATDEEWSQFCHTHARVGRQYNELAGMRVRTSACPLLIKTEIARRVAPYRYDWQTPELDFDDMCRDKERLSKIVPCTSFVSHKLVIAYKYEDL